MDKLPPKQARFVDEYLVDLNGKQAAIRAGYSEKTAAVQASKLLTKANVAEAIASRRTQLQAETQLTQQWVLDGLKQNKERAMQAEPVLDHEGEPTGEYRYEGSVANRALELIGKHLGMFSEKVDVTSGGKSFVVEVPPKAATSAAWAKAAKAK